MAGQDDGPVRGPGTKLLQGSALWDLYFPPTKPGYMAAHTYNLAAGRCWWYWPGDRLYDDWRNILAYDGRPARKADVGTPRPGPRRDRPDHAAAGPDLAAEKERKLRESEGSWTAELVSRGKSRRSGCAWPAAGCTSSCLAHRPTIDVTGFAPGEDNGADVVRGFLRQAGRATARSTRIRPTRSTPAGEAIWTLDVKSRPGVGFRNVGLGIEPAVLISTSNPCWSAPRSSPAWSAIGSWTKASGETVVDTSQEKGDLRRRARGGQWTPGVKGSALALDGRSGGVVVPAASLHQPHPVHPLGLGSPRCIARTGNGATFIDEEAACNASGGGSAIRPDHPWSWATNSTNTAGA